MIKKIKLLTPLLIVFFLIITPKIVDAKNSIPDQVNQICSSKNKSPIFNFLCTIRQEKTTLTNKIESLKNCDGDFSNNGNGTVQDNCSNLQWQQVSSPSNYVWVNASQYCNNLVLAGYSDWRLPSQRELTTLLSFNENPKIFTVFSFGNSSNELNLYSWSSDQSIDNPIRYWNVAFNVGITGAAQGTDEIGARCVRKKTLTH